MYKAYLYPCKSKFIIYKMLSVTIKLWKSILYMYNCASANVKQNTFTQFYTTKYVET